MCWEFCRWKTWCAAFLFPMFCSAFSRMNITALRWRSAVCSRSGNIFHGR